MIEELIVAFLIGLSFNNAFICILLGFGITSNTNIDNKASSNGSVTEHQGYTKNCRGKGVVQNKKQRNIGMYFILGRFIGLLILGIIIALIGVIFIEFIFYFMILFAVLSIIFGAFIIYKVYHRIQHLKNHPNKGLGGPLCRHNIANGKLKKSKNSNGLAWFGGSNSESRNGGGITKQYSFGLGLFRGATPCLKVIILAPLLLIFPLPGAVLLILVFAATSTIYPLIGFLSANVINNFRKYDAYVQTTGAIIIISIGAYMIFNQFIIAECAIGL